MQCQCQPIKEPQSTPEPQIHATEKLQRRENPRGFYGAVRPGEAEKEQDSEMLRIKDVVGRCGRIVSLSAAT